MIRELLTKPSSSGGFVMFCVKNERTASATLFNPLVMARDYKVATRDIDHE